MKRRLCLALYLLVAPSVFGFSGWARSIRFSSSPSSTLAGSVARDDDDPDTAPSASLSYHHNGADEKTIQEAKKRTFSTIKPEDKDDTLDTVNRDPLPVHTSIQSPAGLLCDDHQECQLDDATQLLPHRGRSRKRVLVLCTGGTLTMSHDPTQGNSLAPVQGALTEYMASMRELTDDPEMPEIVSHEYDPLIDSSDMGPGDWALVANDIAANYYHFDGAYSLYDF